MKLSIIHCPLSIVHRTLSIVAALLLIACGGSDDFVIDLDIEGLGDKGIEAIYMERNSVSRLPVHPKEGKARFALPLTGPTLVEVVTIDGDPLFECLGRKGDKIKVKMQLGRPSTLVIDGQAESQAYARFVAENDSLLARSSDAKANALIARAIRENLGSASSSMLLLTRFRTAGFELLADSLLGEIAPEARPVSLTGSYGTLLGEQVAAMVKGEVSSFNVRVSPDSTVRFAPSLQSYGLIAIFDARKPDSLRNRLKGLRADFNRRNLALVELSFARDSAGWRQSIARDSARWQQAWLPGASGSNLLKNINVPRTPYYIVADSASRILYRGTSLYSADTLLRSLIKVKSKDTGPFPADTISAPEPEPTPTHRPTPMTLREAKRER